VIARSGENVIHDEHGRERERHKVPYGATLSVKADQHVKVGTPLATWDPLTRPIITEFAGKFHFEDVEEGLTVANQVDEVTGLSRVAELFEARSPKDKGVLAEITGNVSFGKETKGKIRLQITDPEGKVWEELVPKEKNILVHEGQVVNKGEVVVDGPADPQDILRLLGAEELARYIVDEVQDVYRLQGVKINDKHI